MTQKSEFLAIEIDAVDDALAQTAKRKNIPTLSIEPTHQPENQQAPQRRARTIDTRQAPRKPLSLELPVYLATDLKVCAARQSVTVRHLVLTALADAGYRIDPVDMDEDGRRLR